MIGVVGLGFVGLTTALGFSDCGIQTMGYDVDPERLDTIASGNVPFHEPGLREALGRNIDHTFKLTGSLAELVEHSDIIFICVGTPQHKSGRADLSNVHEVLDKLVEYLKPEERKIVLIKSTVPPLSTNQIQESMKMKLGPLYESLCIGVNPEFLREGHAWEDFIHPDRIVVGICADPVVRSRISQLYGVFDSRLIFTTPNTAEFLKYLSNTLLSTLISFSNEMSLIAKGIGDVNIGEAFRLLHMDKRFDGAPALISSYIYPGCGYGGYCLPKDTMAVLRLSEDIGIDARILRANIDTNETIMERLLENFFREKYYKSTGIGILGLSFKADSDDVRETPAFRCIDVLTRNGFNNILAYDPIAVDTFKKSYSKLKVRYCNSIDELLEGASVIFIVTAWKEFKNIKFEDKVVYDLRYIIS